MNKNNILIILLLFFISILSCKKNDYVLSEGKMENILYELYLGEGVINTSSGSSPQETKRNFYLSVLSKNGVTEEQYDSSLVYYGQNVDEYFKIYDKVVSRLQKEETKFERLVAAEQKAKKSATGDSVDIWTGERHFVILPMNHLQIIRTVPSDENFKIGDSFFVNFTINDYRTESIIQSPKIYLTIAYSDGTLQTTSVPIDHQGDYSISIVGENEKAISRVTCFALPNAHANQNFSQIIGRVNSFIRKHKSEVSNTSLRKNIEIE